MVQKGNAPTAAFASVREFNNVDFPLEGLPTIPINGSLGILFFILLVPFSCSVDAFMLLEVSRTFQLIAQISFSEKFSSDELQEEVYKSKE